MTAPSLGGRTIAVTGASGNVGTAVLRALARAGAGETRGLSRRRPPEIEPYSGVRWFTADLGDQSSEPVLTAFLDGVDAVVHLAWALLPDRRPDVLHRTNVEGTRRVLTAAGAAGVPHVVHMSSIGAYAAGPQDAPVPESWPTTGIPTSTYSRQKSECEQLVRDLAAAHHEMTVSVTRPTLVLQPDAASEIGRYFLGPLLFPLARKVPGGLARRAPLPIPDLSLGFVHSDDVADAIARILDRRAGGAFNLSAPPDFDAAGLAHALGAKRVRFPASVLRAGMQAAFRAHLIEIEPGWLDMGLGVPPLDTTRARAELGWAPAHRGDELLPGFVAALARGDGHPGPLLHRA